MGCPTCGYELDPFETSCPRCTQKSAGVKTQQLKEAQAELEMVLPRRLQQAKRPSEYTPLRIFVITILFCACAAAPLLFTLYAWDSSTISRLTSAAKKDDLKTVTRMITPVPKRVDAKGYRGRASLYWAARTGSIQVAQYLLEQGADINQQDEFGWTPLHVAANRNQLEMVEFLYKGGANVMAMDKHGRTAFHAAAAGGSIETEEFLLKLGFDVNLPDSTGMTPLHLATGNRHLAMVEFLIDHKAEVNARAKNGDTPLRIAYRMKRSDSIITTLVDAGATE